MDNPNYLNICPNFPFLKVFLQRRKHKSKSCFQNITELQEVKSFSSIQMGFLMVDSWNVCIEPVHPDVDKKPVLTDDLANSALWNSCFTETEDFLAVSELMDQDITDSSING